MAYSNSSNLNRGNGYINSSRQGNNGKWNGARNSGFHSGSQGSRQQDAPDAYTPLDEANYVAIAESAVKKLEKDQHEHYKLSTSKIRNILAMTSEILNKVNSNRGKDPALAHEGDHAGSQLPEDKAGVRKRPRACGEGS